MSINTFRELQTQLEPDQIVKRLHQDISTLWGARISPREVEQIAYELAGVDPRAGTIRVNTKYQTSGDSCIRFLKQAYENEGFSIISEELEEDIVIGNISDVVRGVIKAERNGELSTSELERKEQEDYTLYEIQVAPH